MLVDLKTFVAFMCPFCSNVSTNSLSVFAFSGGYATSLICPTNGCHEECAKIVPKSDKYIIEIQCPICGDTHKFNVKKERFFNKSLITFRCPFSGIEIFFIGEIKRIEDAIEKNLSKYASFLESFEDENISMIYEMIECLKDLQEDDSLSCVCGNKKLSINISDSSISVVCPKCNRTKIFEVNKDNLNSLLNINNLTIGK